MALGRLYVEPEPRAPRIGSLSYDENSGELIAEVESGNPDHPNSEIAWIRAFHPDLDGGVVQLEPVVDYFRHPHRYTADLGAGFQATDLELVAYVQPGVYASEILQDDSVDKPDVLAIGTHTLVAWTTVTSGNLWRWRTISVNQDGAPAQVEATTPITIPFVEPDRPGLPFEFYARVNGPNFFSGATVGWNATYQKIGNDRNAYRSATREDLKQADNGSTTPLAIGELGCVLE